MEPTPTIAGDRVIGALPLNPGKKKGELDDPEMNKGKKGNGVLGHTASKSDKATNNNGGNRSVSSRHTPHSQ